MRRIVTGHNSEGKSVIILDGPPARSIGEDVGGLFELWNTDGFEIISTDDIDRADNEIILSPPKNGTKFRYFQIINFLFNTLFYTKAALLFLCVCILSPPKRYLLVRGRFVVSKRPLLKFFGKNPCSPKMCTHSKHIWISNLYFPICRS